jgi:hypothetical protein
MHWRHGRRKHFLRDIRLLSRPVCRLPKPFGYLTAGPRQLTKAPRSLTKGFCGLAEPFCQPTESLCRLTKPLRRLTKAFCRLTKPFCQDEKRPKTAIFERKRGKTAKKASFEGKTPGIFGKSGDGIAGLGD